MNLRELKGLTQYNNRKLAEVIGCSLSAVTTNLQRRTDPSKPEHQERIRELFRLETLIKENSPDKILLVHEWEILTGCDYSNMNSERVSLSRPNKGKPSDNLKSVTLQKLITIRKNNYKSLSYKNYTYDSQLVDNEIERKLTTKRIGAPFHCPNCNK